MSFAQIGEEVFLRQSELSGEELRLYMIIFFCTFRDTGFCRYNLKELCEKYSLSYDSHCRHYKQLRAKGWAENFKGKIRPLIGIKTDKNSVATPKESSNPIKQTDETSVETANLQDETDENSVLAVLTDETSVGSTNPKLTKTQFQTDENSVSENSKLTKTQFEKIAYKEFPEPLKHPEPIEPKKRDISPEVSKKHKNFTTAEKARRLFEFWQKRMKSKRSIFTKDRKQKAEKILAEIGYGDCLRAVIGCTKSDWHMGRDPANQTLYNEFERIFKKVEEPEKFIRRYQLALVKKQLNTGGNDNGISSSNNSKTPNGGTRQTESRLNTGHIKRPSL